VDRVAILLVDAQGELAPKISRDKRGGDAPRAVPQSIAKKAVFAIACVGSLATVVRGVSTL